MAEKTETAPATGDGQQEPEPAGAWGKVIDIAGVIAVCVLAVIAVDIFTGGAITRRFRKQDDETASADRPA